MHPAIVYVFLASLAVAGAMVCFAVWGVYHFMDSYDKAHQPPQNPMTPTQAETRVVTSEEIQQFSAPRLETDERSEIGRFRLEEEQRLHSYGWVDQPAGVVRIPIERAMELVAQRGLPTTPRAGEAPSSTVKVINEATERSDTSAETPQNKPQPQGGKGPQ
jgi:hypothetical protein